MRLALVLPAAVTAYWLEPYSYMRTDERSVRLTLVLSVAATACRLSSEKDLDLEAKQLDCIVCWRILEAVPSVWP